MNDTGTGFLLLGGALLFLYFERARNKALKAASANPTGAAATGAAQPLATMQAGAPGSASVPAYAALPSSPRSGCGCGSH